MFEWIADVLLSVPRAVGLPDWLSCTLIAFLALYYYATMHYGCFRKMGVRHPPPYPLIGNLPQTRSAGPFYDSEFAEKYGRIFGLYEGRVPVLYVADADAARDICIKQFGNFVNRRTKVVPIMAELKESMTVARDAKWKGLRSVISPTFSGSKLRRITPLIVKCGARLAKTVGSFADKSEEADLRELGGEFTMDVIARTLFGLSTQTSDDESAIATEFVKNAKAFLYPDVFRQPALIASYLVPGVVPFLEWLGCNTFNADATEYFKRTIYEMIDMRQRLQKKPEDFLQLMLDARNTDADDEENMSSLYQTTADRKETRGWRVGKRALSKTEVFANCAFFLIGAYDTAATALCWSFHEMLQQPDIQQRLYAEIVDALPDGRELTYDVVNSMEYLDCFLSETLRLHGPIKRFDRQCENECQVAGVTIPKGMSINVCAWAIHHDERYWPEPNKFDPERFWRDNRERIHPYSFLPFGAGPRNCMGMRKALLEAKIGIVCILRDFRVERSENTEDTPLLQARGLIAPANGIRVRVVRR